MTKKILTKIIAFVMCIAMLTPVLAACKKYEPNLRFKAEGEYTYNTFLSAQPKGWNPHTWSTSTDGDMISWLYTPFYSYIIDPSATEVTFGAGHKMTYEAARALPIDVTSEYVGQFGIEEGDSGYAWKIKLNPDLKWDNGDPIVAADFEYSMQQLLNPERLNGRNTSYTRGTTELVGAKAYYNAGAPDMTPIVTYTGSTPVYSQLPVTHFTISQPCEWFGYADSLMSRIQVLLDAGVKQSEIDAIFTRGEGSQAVNVLEALLELEDDFGYIEIDLATAAGQQLYADLCFVVVEYYAFRYEFVNGPSTDYGYQTWYQYLREGYFGVTDLYDLEQMGDYLLEFCFNWDGESVLTTTWDEVGCKADATDNSIMFVYTTKQSQDDIIMGAGSSFLVHKATYEAGQRYVENALLTTYNTSLATTRSWGAYKLTALQVDKEIIFEKNPYWYGFSTGTSKVEGVGDYEGKADFEGKTYAQIYAGQYTCTRVYYVILADTEVAKLYISEGLIDRIGISKDQVEKFQNSPERWRRTPSDSVWGFSITTGMEMLRTISANSSTSKNVEVLAIPEFRFALSQALDRLGLMNRYYTASTPAVFLYSGIQFLSLPYDVSILIRETPQGKQTIIDLYNLEELVGAGKPYATMAEALSRVSGYDLAQAKENFIAAYTIAKSSSNGLGWTYDDTPIVINSYIPMGIDYFPPQTQLEFDEIKAMWQSAVAGTGFAGKLTVNFIPVKDYSTMYDDIAAGKIEMANTSIGGANETILDILEVYMDPTSEWFMQAGFDPSQLPITLTMKTAGTTGTKTWTAGEQTKSLADWYEIEKYMYAQKSKDRSDVADWEYDMITIACAMEGAVLKNATFIPYSQTQSATFYGYKTESASTVYNYFAGFGGGVRQMTFNYDDAQWYAFVKEKGGKLVY